MWVNPSTVLADDLVMGGLADQTTRGETERRSDALVERAVNAVVHLGEDRSPWTVADALAFVLESETVAGAVAHDVARRLSEEADHEMTAGLVVASVRAAGVDFGRAGRGAAQLDAVSDVAEMLPDLDPERSAVALDLLRRGGGTADLAVLLVPSDGSAPTTPRPADAVDPLVAEIVAAHLAGQLDALAQALPRETLRALGASCERADVEVPLADPDVGAHRVLWDDEAVAEWLDVPAEGYEALYRATLARSEVRAFLDVLVDHAGRRMSGEEICAQASDDSLRTPNDLSGALNGMRAAVRSTGRSAPFRSWPGRPIRYGIHPTVAIGFVDARRRLLGAAPTA